MRLIGFFTKPLTIRAILAGPSSHRTALSGEQPQHMLGDSPVT